MIEEEFKEALCSAGIPTKDPIIANGSIQRFHIEGDRPNSKNGWYVLFDGEFCSGVFGSWKHNIKFNWNSKAITKLSESQRTLHFERIQEINVKLTEEKLKRYALAQEKAKDIWAKGLPCPSHAYTSSKGVYTYNLRVSRGDLLVPVCDAYGEIQSLQFIDEFGNKRFLAGGRKKACFFLLGQISDAVCIAEGYATAASIFEVTHIPVAIAFDAGNLVSVAMEIRKKHPHIKIILCADNDSRTPNNPGVEFAKKAASVVGAVLAVAEYPE